MYLFYNLVVILGGLLAWPLGAGLLLCKAKYRQGLIQRLGRLPRTVSMDLADGTQGHGCYWLHAVSVGEVVAAEPVMRELRKRYPQLRAVVSTFTASGQEVARSRLKEADHLIFFPFDVPWIVQRVIDRIRPRFFLTMETELWPNFLRCMRRKGIPAMIVNGRISPRSYSRYKRIRGFMGEVLSHLTVCAMQTPEDAKRIIALGANANRVAVVGNIKFDQVLALVQGYGHLPTEEAPVSPLRQGRMMIAGSTHRGEEEIVIGVFCGLRKEFADLRLILAPRHLERLSEVEGILSQFGLPWVRWTALDGRLRVEGDGDRGVPPVVLLDTLGELVRLYRLGTILFVGGSLVPVGGHNVLEPIAYKKPVFFGPHMHNFQEIAELLMTSGGGICVQGGEELRQQASELLRDPERLTALGERAFAVLQAHSGAVERNLRLLEQHLPCR